MADNLISMLRDPEVIPSEKIIVKLVGERMKLWQSVLDYAIENNKSVSGSWNYYKDGKSWLFKLVQNKKTIFWAGIFDGTFRITFYFGDKAEPLISESDLPASVINEFKTGKRFGSIRGISFRLTDNEDVENICKLIDIKRKIK